MDYEKLTMEQVDRLRTTRVERVAAVGWIGALYGLLLIADRLGEITGAIREAQRS